MPGGHATTRHGGAQIGANWAEYGNADIQVYHTEAGNGTASWCQETGVDSSRRVFRGYRGIAYFFTYAASYSSSNLGWRPVLSLVQPGEEPYLTIDDGPDAGIHRGAWNNETTYQYSDIVSYDGSDYKALQTTTGNVPDASPTY